MTFNQATAEKLLHDSFPVCVCVSVHMYMRVGLNLTWPDEVVG